MTVGKTETFFSANVRLMTFLIVIGLFLVIFIPVGIIGINDFLASAEEKNDGKLEITPAQVLILASQVEPLRMNQLTRFKGEWERGESGDYYYMSIGERYLVLAIADHSTGIVWSFTAAKTETGEQVDLYHGENINAFFGLD